MGMIEIKNLTKYYGDFLAVNNVDFSINKGEILGLLGPNGAGKTTIIRILTCFFPPSSGDITVNGDSVQSNSEKIKKIIGYLPESAPLYNDMIVFDYLNYIADLRGIEKESRQKRIAELTELCGLTEKIHSNINELSKGYRQRVGLAHAMMDNPEILVLDEPTSGLDPNQIVEIRKIIKTIGKEKTVIFSSHILQEIEATCDKVVIIDNGSIVANGTTADLKKKSARKKILIVDLENVTPDVLKKEFDNNSSDYSVKEISQNGKITTISLASEKNRDIRKDIYKIIKSKNWELLTFKQDEMSLESIFQELTGGKNDD